MKMLKYLLSFIAIFLIAAMANGIFALSNSKLGYHAAIILFYVVCGIIGYLNYKQHKD